MVSVLLALPAGAGAGFGVTGGVEGLWQGDGAQVRVIKSPNGKFLGNVAAATTIQGCPAAKDHTLWIIDSASPVHGQSAKVYASDCTDAFGSGTFEVQTAGGDEYLRVCTGEPSAGTPAPASSAAPGTLPAAVGATGCADLKRVTDAGDPAIKPHTAGDYVKNIRRGKCVLKFGPTSFFVRIANVSDDLAVRVLFSNNGHSAQTGDKAGKEYRFDLPAKKGANHVKVTVKTFHGKTYVKKKTLFC